MSTRALASSIVHRLSDDEADDFAAAFVGVATFSELVTYRKEANLPDPEDVLDGKVTFTHNPKRLDISFAVLGSTSTILSQSKDRTSDTFKKRAEVMFELMNEVAEDAVDVAWPAARTLSKANLHKVNKASRKLFDRLLPTARSIKAA
jgi:hypothetical protein